MKKIKYTTIAITLLLVVVMVLLYQQSQNTSFQEVVLNKVSVDEISSLQVISRLYDSADEEEVLITNKQEIAEILNYLSQFELSKSKLSNITYTESFWITIKTGEERAFGLTLYDNAYLSVYQYIPQRSASYRIKNEVGPPTVIRELFGK